MSFTIGIGVLFEDNANNRLRKLELLIAEKTGNWRGLSQPPHVTIKIPFEVTDMNDVQTVKAAMIDLAQQTDRFLLELDGFGNFEDKVIYGSVKNPQTLLTLSNHLIDELTEPGETQDYERSRMIFHSTLAMNLSATQYSAASKSISNEKLTIQTQALGLGLFLGIDDLQHWAVIHQEPFRNYTI